MKAAVYVLLLLVILLALSVPGSAQAPDDRLMGPGRRVVEWTPDMTILISTGGSSAAVGGSPKVDCSDAPYFEPRCSGLPDYKRDSPFTSGRPRDHAALARRLASAKMAPGDCRVFDAIGNICRESDFVALRDLVGALAPRLRKSGLGLWKADLKGAGQHGLLVEYSSEGHFNWPYLSLWWLENRHGRYTAAYGGSYLDGEVHAIQPFGASNKARRVFVRHQSCVQCCPSIFLTILDFSYRPTARPFRFTYARHHKDFGDVVAYELPGMGHSIDADVTTKVPARPAPNRPHLMQHFRYLHEDKHEWWIFTCAGLICDYEMYVNRKIPARYRTLWESGKKL